MKKALLLLPMLFLFNSFSYGYETGYFKQECERFKSQGCILSGPGVINGIIVPSVMGAKGPIKYKVASLSLTTISSTRSVYCTAICAGDKEYNYLKTNKATISEGLGEIMSTNPLDIDNYDCSQFSDSYSQEMCESTITLWKGTDTYKNALEQKEKKKLKKNRLN